MVYVTAVIEIAPGKRDEFLAAQKSLLPLVRAEAGCIEYLPAIDLPSGAASQPPLRPDVVVMHEKWESLAALQAHFVAPHMGDYRARVKSLVVKTTVYVTEPTEK